MQGEGTRIRVSESSSYDRYVRAEWALFAAEPARGAAARAVLAARPVVRALDVGCGAGQELRPFLGDGRSFGIGIDVAPEAGQVGRRLFAAEQPGSRVAFARAAAERLPFGADCFEVVICRLTLPYTDNARALAVMARVVRPDGCLLVKFHHGRFYLRKLREALAAGRVRAALHACRVLAAGALYHLTGAQPRGRLTGGETFQTAWLLRRELRRHGLGAERALEDSSPETPSLLIRRRSRIARDKGWL